MLFKHTVRLKIAATGGWRVSMKEGKIKGVNVKWKTMLHLATSALLLHLSNTFSPSFLSRSTRHDPLPLFSLFLFVPLFITGGDCQASQCHLCSDHPLPLPGGKSHRPLTLTNVATRKQAAITHSHTVTTQ